MGEALHTSCRAVLLICTRGDSGWHCITTTTSYKPRPLLLNLTYSGNMRPASIKIYLSCTPTSMQFMPISPKPPIGNTRKGGPPAGGGPGKGLAGTVSNAEPKWVVPLLDLKTRCFFQEKGSSCLAPAVTSSVRHECIDPADGGSGAGCT